MSGFILLTAIPLLLTSLSYWVVCCFFIFVYVINIYWISNTIYRKTIWIQISKIYAWGINTFFFPSCIIVESLVNLFSKWAEFGFVPVIVIFGDSKLSASFQWWTDMTLCIVWGLLITLVSIVPVWQSLRVVSLYPFWLVMTESYYLSPCGKFIMDEEGFSKLLV